MVQNDKKILSVLLHIRKHTSYDCHVCFFSFFQSFDFLGRWGGKRAKNGSKMTKILPVALHISGTIHHMIVIYATHV